MQVSKVFVVRATDSTVDSTCMCIQCIHEHSVLLITVQYCTVLVPGMWGAGEQGIRGGRHRQEGPRHPAMGDGAHDRRSRREGTFFSTVAFC